MMSHPNVVHTLELAQAEGRWFVAMELVRGPSVLTLAAKRGRLPGAAVIEIGIQTAAGLAHIHGLTVADQGLVHRDIKPQNLLVDPSGLVKVADLGASRMAIGGVAGTPAFMAPEQHAGREDARADLFSLGVTLFLLATGRLPFGRAASGRLEISHIARCLADPRFFAPVSHQIHGLDAVLARCLRIDPSERWRDAEALGAALRTLLRDQDPGGGLTALLRGRDDPPPPGRSVPVESQLSTVLRPEGNLPRVEGAFIGRAEVRAEIQGLLAQADLVTIRGAGGMGKTRLALAVGHALAPMPVWFCPLAQVTDTDGLARAIAAALDIPMVGIEALGHAMASRSPCVLILDQLEHLRGEVGPVIGEWRGLGIRFLITSQVALGIGDERVVSLGPMDRHEAIALFQDRAIRPASDDEVDKLAILVDRLDGAPLAIELAAARTQALRVPQILERLEQRFQLLRDDERSEPRHRSLVASLEESWSLLDNEQKAVLAQLSTFRGGFDLAAAEAVVDVGGSGWVLDVLDRLVRHSLVRATPDRFHLLQSVALFASTRLALREEVENRHGRHFASFGRPEVLATLDRVAGTGRWEALAADLDNLMVATRRAVARRDPDVASATALAAWAVLQRRGPLVTAALLIDAALTVSPDDARLHCASVAVATELDQDPEPRLERALGAARSQGDTRAEGIVTRLLGVHDQARGNMDQARACYDAALALHQADGDLDLEGQVHNSLGNLHSDRGRWTQAEKSYRQALTLLRRTGDEANEASALCNLGNLLDKLGRQADALKCHQDSVQLHRARRDRRREALALGNMAVVQAKMGCSAEARTLLEEALSIHRQLGHRRMQGVVLHNLAKLDVDAGRLEEAEQAYEASLRLHRAVGNKRGEGMALVGVAELQDRRGDTEMALHTLQHTLPILAQSEDRRTEGVAYLVIGQVNQRRGQLKKAKVAFERALARFGGLGDLGNEILTRMHLGEVALGQGRAGRGRAVAGGGPG